MVGFYPFTLCHRRSIAGFTVEYCKMKINFRKILLYGFAVLSVVVLSIITVGLASVLVSKVKADTLGVVNDEPIIIHDAYAPRDVVSAGVVGNESVHLYRTEHQTIGIVGDNVIHVNHFPDREFRPRIPVQNDLLSEESIRNPLQDGGDQ